MTAGAPTDTVIMYPGLVYRDAPAAIEWLCRVFGFERLIVVEGGAGTVAHAELALGSGVVMVNSLSAERGDRQGTAGPYVYLEQVDEHYRRAVAEGAEVVYDLEDKDYGGRGYSVRDPEGYLWSFGSYRPAAGG